MHWLALLRRNPAFARFWLSEAISLAGDWFSLVAVSVLAVERGGAEGALAVAITLALYDIPMALVRPFGGVLADRFDRRDLLIGVHLGQAALTGIMVWRAAAGDLVALQGLVLARSLLAGLDWPARTGALRRLVPAEDLILANAFTGATWSAMFAFGMAFGGVVVTIGVAPALACDAVTFLFAAALLATLEPMPTRAVGNLAEALRRTLSDLAEAVRLASRNPQLLEALTAKTPVALAGGAGVVMLNVLAAQTGFAGSGALSLGLLQATRGVGTGIGPLLAERLIAGRVGTLAGVWAGAVVLAMAGIALLALGEPHAVAMLAAALVWGMGTGANWMLSAAELQRRAPDEAIGRLSGLDMLSTELAFGVSALLGGLVIDATHVPGAGAVLAIALGVATWRAARALVASRVAAAEGPGAG